MCLCVQEEQGADLHSLDLESLEQLKYTGCVIKETLRINPPVPGGFRVALKTFELNVSLQLFTRCVKKWQLEDESIGLLLIICLVLSGFPNSQRLERYLQHL